MTKVSNDYFAAHGYLAENHEKKINGVSNKAYTHKSNNSQTNAGPPPVTTSTQSINQSINQSEKYLTCPE